MRAQWIHPTRLCKRDASYHTHTLVFDYTSDIINVASHSTNYTQGSKMNNLQEEAKKQWQWTGELNGRQKREKADVPFARLNRLAWKKRISRAESEKVERERRQTKVKRARVTGKLFDSPTARATTNLWEQIAKNMVHRRDGSSWRPMATPSKIEWAEKATITTTPWMKRTDAGLRFLLSLWHLLKRGDGSTSSSKLLVWKIFSCPTWPVLVTLVSIDLSLSSLRTMLTCVSLFKSMA